MIQMTVLLNINIEVALFNENVLSWESLIEPSIDPVGYRRSPWGITCSIAPVGTYFLLVWYISFFQARPLGNEADQNDDVQSSNFKRLIRVETDQYLNITMTKTGFDLVQRLSALLSDAYNKRLLPTDDDNLPILSVLNGTGREITIEQLDDLQVDFDRD